MQIKGNVHVHTHTYILIQTRTRKIMHTNTVHACIISLANTCADEGKMRVRIHIHTYSYKHMNSYIDEGEVYMQATTTCMHTHINT